MTWMKHSLGCRKIISAGLKAAMAVIVLFYPLIGVAYTLDFEWNCPHSKVGAALRNVPSQATIQLEWEPGKKLDLTPLETFFAPLLNQSTPQHLNYGMCFQATNERLSMGVERICKQKKFLVLPVCNNSSVRLLNSNLHDFWERISRHQRYNLDFGPFLPMEQLEEPASSHDHLLDQETASFERNCQHTYALPTIAGRSVALSKEFLTSRIPLIIARRPECEAPLHGGLKFIVKQIGTCAQTTPQDADCARGLAAKDALNEFISKQFADLERREAEQNTRDLARFEAERLAACERAAHPPGTELTKVVDAVIKKLPEDPCVLEIGEAISPKPCSRFRPTCVKRAYRLTRAGEDQYLAQFNLRFQPRGRPFDPEQNAKWHNKVKTCFAWASAGIQGPRGERITFELVGENEALAPQRRDIELVDEPGFRAHSSAYRTNIDCETIMHEVFHLFGLVDEYPEVTTGPTVTHKTGKIQDSTVESYGCRALGPLSSIMHDQRRALSPLHSGRAVRILPAQFNVIVFPECAAKNTTYYKCSEPAYETHFGDCFNIPPICKEPGYKWLGLGGAK